MIAIQMRLVAVSLALCLAVAASPQTGPVPEARLREAVERSLPLLQSTDATFIKKAQCVSCHHNSLTAMTVAEVRKAGLRVNEDIARQQKQAIADYAESWRGRLSQGIHIPGGPDAVSYILVGLGAEQYPADSASDVMASYLLDLQSPDGRWRIQAKRPPIESSDFTVTATSLRALQLYAPKPNAAAFDNAVQAAFRWMLLAQPASTEDRVFRMLALHWAGGSEEMIHLAGRQLAADQRPDGSWSQLLHMPGDAYATGEALVALQEAAGLPSNETVIQRGIRFLLETQQEDGSWHVKTRSTPIQPYFESGFPYGEDQWISVAATNWATRALALALQHR